MKPVRFDACVVRYVSGVRHLKKHLWGLYALFVLMMSEQAHAYLDAGSGSMLLQVILGGLAGAVVALKYYWQQVKAFLGFKKVNK